MSKQTFNAMQIDAIGEIMNISLGSSATAVSNMLDSRVDITTPTVTVVNAEDFTLGDMEPAVGVEIRYVSGLEGSNIMLLKFKDVKVIVDILMGMETPDDEFELNDLSLSAVCEVMNQMMGAASTALSDFLGRMVNISTPQTFDGNNVEALRKERFPVSMGPIVLVRFALTIGENLKSEFMNVMSVDLARELIAGFGLDDSPDEPEEPEIPAPAPAPAESSGGGQPLSQEEIEALMMGAAAPAPAPAADAGAAKPLSQEEIEALMMGGSTAAPAPAPADEGGGKKLSQEEIEALMMGGGTTAPAPAPAPAPADEGGGKKLSQEEIEALMMGGGASAAPAPQPAPQPVPQPAPQPTPQPAQQPAAQGMPQMQPGQMPQMQPGQMPQMPFYPPYYGWPQPAQDGSYPPPPPGYYMPPPNWGPPQAEKVPENKVVKTKPAPLPVLEDGTTLSEEQSQNLDLIMGVPLELAVEIGRTRKKVQEILALSKGSLVVLDKLAGDQVDIYVNGKCIARGDVVVIDDNFGIRINEILRKPGLEDLK